MRCVHMHIYIYIMVAWEAPDRGRLPESKLASSPPELFNKNAFTVFITSPIIIHIPIYFALYKADLPSNVRR